MPFGPATLLMLKAAPQNCSLDFGQTKAYTYDSGCGYCDWKDLCSTTAYCSTCCSNEGNVLKNNQCRVNKVLQPAPVTPKVVAVPVHVINNNAGDTIDLLPTGLVQHVPHHQKSTLNNTAASVLTINADGSVSQANGQLGKTIAEPSVGSLHTIDNQQGAVIDLDFLLIL